MKKGTVAKSFQGYVPNNTKKKRFPLRISAPLLKKSLMKNFIFCAVQRILC